MPVRNFIYLMIFTVINVFDLEVDWYGLVIAICSKCLMVTLLYLSSRLISFCYLKIRLLNFALKQTEKCKVTN